MSLFDWLLVGHVAGDFLLQTRWMAENKIRRWRALLAHAASYTLVVALLALPAGGLRPAALLLVFATHCLLDRRTFVHWWAERVTALQPGGEWLRIVQDQAWHLLVLALVASW